MWFAKPYPGYSASNSAIRRSRYTFATMDADAMEKLIPSPLAKLSCGCATSGIVRLSTRTCCGTGARLSSAIRIARKPAW
ncbi:hypothetical protein D3C83_27850 [compost metagenome]